jgi:phosphoglycolate phosphatase-like HAD superfamily hydrolase
MSPANDLSGIRAVICDVYGTLLQVGPPSKIAAHVWQTLLPSFGGGGDLSLEEFNACCEALVASENEGRRRCGEPFPDVDWLNIVSAVIGKPRGKAANVSVLHAHCTRRCQAMPGALKALARLRAGGVKCGLASNAQFYTSNELGNAGFRRKDFTYSLRFLSGDHGFAKPSPRVFSFLNERLSDLGIAPHETLMIGDSLENDITPAIAAGWRTWHIGPRTWEELLSLVPLGAPLKTR